jgi:hypothetical protein
VVSVFNNCDNNRRRTFRTYWLMLCLLVGMGGFCGCSTVQPELTAEERVYNQQVREQGSAQGVSPGDDLNPAEKVLCYVGAAALLVLDGLCQGHYSFTP